MSRFILLAITAITWLFCPEWVSAQYRSTFSHAAAELAGLERVWRAQATLNTALGQVNRVKLHLSKKHFTYFFGVTHGDQTITFNSRTLDRFGEPIGREAAARLADIEQRVLKSKGIEATLAERKVPDVTILLQTSRGVIQGIDAESGRTLWVMSAGNPNYPSLGPAADDDYAAMINGSTLYVYNLAEGKVAWSRRLDSAPIAEPIITDGRIFVPLLRGVVLGFDLGQTTKHATSMTSIGRPVTSPTSTNVTLSWGTDRGFLYVANPRTSKPLFRLEASDLLTGSAVSAPDDLLIAASRDGYVYAVGETIGEIVWRFSLGNPIDQPVVVIGEHAYVTTTIGQLFSLSTNVGAVEWIATGVDRVLASSGTRLYCAGHRGGMVVIDIESGSRLGTAAVNTDGAITNMINDRVYLTTSSGAIACLREPQNVDQIFHVDITEKKSAAEAAEDRPRKEGPTSENPFADEGDAGDNANPFGGDAALDEDPFGSDADAGEAADPFAEEGDAFIDEDPFGGGDDTGDVEDPFAEDGDAGRDGPDGEIDEDDPFAEGGDSAAEDPFAE